MAPHITCQTTLVPASRFGPVEGGVLIFADDVLMAVIMHLEKSVSVELRGQWFLEAGFGPCSVAPGAEPLFPSPAEAQQWVLKRILRGCESQRPQTA